MKLVSCLFSYVSLKITESTIGLRTINKKPQFVSVLKFSKFLHYFTKIVIKAQWSLFVKNLGKCLFNFLGTHTFVLALLTGKFRTRNKSFNMYFSIQCSCYLERLESRFSNIFQFSLKSVRYCLKYYILGCGVCCQRKLKLITFLHDFPNKQDKLAN